MDIFDRVRQTTKEREAVYGDPRLNHQATAELFKAYVHRRFGVFLKFDGVDVCYLNILQKISREANGRSPDAKVDIAGYAENAVRCEE